MRRRPPRSTRTYTLFPSTALVRSSDLVEQRDSTNTDQEKLELVCRGCGAEPDWDDAIADAVDRALSNEAYDRFKDAGESGPIFDCPACDRAAYVDFEEACDICGESFRSEEPPSELMSLMRISYAVFCL